MNNERQIIVLGAGIAGLAAAIALVGRGFSVDVYEQASEVSEVGAGLQISPNGFAVLVALGLGPQVREMGTALTSVNLLDYQNPTPVLKLDMARYAADQTYLAIHRHDLITLLAEHATSVGANIHFDHRVEKVESVRGKTKVAFKNGTNVSPPIVVGADGLHSKTRDYVDGPQTAVFSGQVAWRATVPIDRSVEDVACVYMAPNKHVVIYPLRGGQLMNIVAVQETNDWVPDSWKIPGDPALFREVFSEFPMKIKTLCDKVNAVTVWGLNNRPVAARWHRNGCVLIGDAAHPTLPFLAQGANLALEDAWVLADCLAHQPSETALETYQDKRKARVTRVINAANANAGNFHLSNPVVRHMAHMVLRIAGRLAPRFMVRRFDWICRHDVTAAKPR